MSDERATGEDTRSDGAFQPHGESGCNAVGWGGIVVDVFPDIGHRHLPLLKLMGSKVDAPHRKVCRPQPNYFTTRYRPKRPAEFKDCGPLSFGIIRLMNITKREFMRLSLGGLVANEVARRIDAAHNIPHVPTVSTVASVHDEVEPDNRFWNCMLPDGRKIDQWDIQPGAIYARFESHELTSNTAYATYDPPYIEGKRKIVTSSKDIYGENYTWVDAPVDEWEFHNGKIDGAFAQGHMPFNLEPFNKGVYQHIADTNLHGVGGKLCAPEHFAAFGASIILDRTTSDKDVALFERNTCFTFHISHKCYYYSQATMMTSRADMDELVQRGQPTNKMPVKMRRWDPPIMIGNDIQFHFALNTIPTDFGEFGGFVWLDGYHARGVC